MADAQRQSANHQKNLAVKARIAANQQKLIAIKADAAAKRAEAAVRKENGRLTGQTAQLRSANQHALSALQLTRRPGPASPGQSEVARERQQTNCRSGAPQKHAATTSSLDLPRLGSLTACIAEEREGDWEGAARRFGGQRTQQARLRPEVARAGRRRPGRLTPNVPISPRSPSGSSLPAHVSPCHARHSVYPSITRPPAHARSQYSIRTWRA